MKIITVTLNPCIDINYKLDFPLVPGILMRVPKGKQSISGKGINVSKALKNLGEESVILGFFGEDSEDEELRKKGYNVSAVKCSGKLRRNTSILDVNGIQTKLNEPGFSVTENELKEFISLYKSELMCGGEKAVIISGSIPEGVEKNIYKKLVKIAKNNDAFVAVDADGQALKAALEAYPDLIKPNKCEFEELIGEKLEGKGEGLRLGAVRKALEFSRNNNCVSVLCTLDEDGSVYAGEGGSFMCQAVKTNVENFNGAGDTFLATFIYEHKVKENGCEVSLIKAAAEASRAISR